jgi:hypothetical protein
MPMIGRLQIRFLAAALLVYTASPTMAQQLPNPADPFNLGGAVSDANAAMQANLKLARDMALAVEA